MAKKLVVEREIYVKNDKEYYSYFVKGIIRGKEYKVIMTPPDFGGYNVLEIVYNGGMSAELIEKAFQFKDASGKVISGTNFEVSSVDLDTGEVYTAPIKPFRASDKSLLSMMLR